jgi:hypothetical protein
MHCIVVTSYTSSESDENSRADILNLIDDNAKDDRFRAGTSRRPSFKPQPFGVPFLLSPASY